MGGLIKGRQTQEREKHLKTQYVHNDIGTAAVGYVVVPPEMGLDDYIEDCYRTHTVTIWGGRGFGFFNCVHVTSRVMQEIQFPENPFPGASPVRFLRFLRRRPANGALYQMQQTISLYPPHRRPGNYLIHTIGDTEAVNAALPPLAAAALILLSIILTLIGGIIPSKTASKQDPVTALRSE